MIGMNFIKEDMCCKIKPIIGYVIMLLIIPVVFGLMMLPDSQFGLGFSMGIVTEMFLGIIIGIMKLAIHLINSDETT